MTPLISVLLAVATTLSIFSIAIAKGDILKNAPDWLVPVLIVISGALYILAAILAVIHWQNKQTKAHAVPLTPPAPIHLENIGNPVVRIEHNSSPVVPQRTKAQDHEYETAKTAISQLGPQSIVVLRFLCRHGEVKFGMYPPAQLPDNISGTQMQAILDSLARLGLVSRRDNQEPRNQHSAYDIAPSMKPALQELLY